MYEFGLGTLSPEQLGTILMSAQPPPGGQALTELSREVKYDERMFCYAYCGLCSALIGFFWVLLLGRPLPFGLASNVAFASPVAALIFALVAGWVWSFGVRHYQGTGS